MPPMSDGFLQLQRRREGLSSSYMVALRGVYVFLLFFWCDYSRHVAALSSFHIYLVLFLSAAATILFVFPQ